MSKPNIHIFRGNARHPQHGGASAAAKAVGEVLWLEGMFFGGGAWGEGLSFEGGDVVAGVGFTAGLMLRLD